MNARPQAWLDQAINDLEMARLAASQGFFAQACFFSSQSAEKALEGAILEIGVPTQACEKLRLKPLSRMAKSTRYPNEAINCDAAVLVQVESWDSN